jgi:formate dehydrogenase subunit gamma
MPFILRVAVLAALLSLVGHATGQAQAWGQEVKSNQFVTDDAKLMQQLKQTEMPQTRIEGRVYIPDTKAGVLIQPQGRWFRDFHIGPARWIAGGLLALAVLVTIAMYLLRGSRPVERDAHGRTLLRFGSLDRFAHWITASSFIVLALTGLNILFGRTLLQPLVGDSGFAELTQWGKVAHNFLSFPFTLGIVLMLVLWVKDNLPNGTDLTWLKTGGGLFGGREPPAGKFNGGQKIIFWIVVLGGGAVAATGYMLLFPFYLADIAGMQIFQILHSLIAGAMIATIIGHIYLGTVGVPGSFEAMATGSVDFNWAKEHHPIWVQEEAGKTQPAPAGGTARPIGAD